MFETLSGKKEYSVSYTINGNLRTYFPDFLVENKIIEIKPKKLCGTAQNKLKFDAAIKKYGNDFIVITENDIEKISFELIIELKEKGELIFIPRYEKKINEYITKI